MPASVLDILLVDDEPKILAALRRVLRKAPVVLRCAGTAEEALDELNRRVPHVVIADHQMWGGLSGLELLNRVRRDHPRVACYLHSASPPPVREDSGIHILQKPVDPSRLLELLDALAGTTDG